MNSILKRLPLVILLLAATPMAWGQMVVGPWIPIYKGVDRAVGTNFPTGATNTLQVVNCVRVDLTDPDVQLLPTPRASNYVANSTETYSLSVSNFLKKNALQIAIAANFYNTVAGPSPTSEGVSANPEGLLVTTGTVVSAVGDSRYCSLLFTTNKTAILMTSNAPPGTNLTGIYNAVSGFYAVITNGTVVASNFLWTAYPDQTVHSQRQPRTIFGLSQDRRYLYLMIIDGRQGGYSNGSFDEESAAWAIAFGMYDAVNMDGGGSAAMYMANCSGDPVALGHSSYTGTVNPPRERYIGAHFGVYALSLEAFRFLNIAATGGVTTAGITWITESNSTSQVEYGLTTSLGTFSPVDSSLVTNHFVSLSGLLSGRRYYYRVISTDAGNVQHTPGCNSIFDTINPGAGTAFPMATTWKYSVTNLDGTNWNSLAFDDSTWPQGPAVLWAYNGAPPPYWSTFVPNYSSGGTRMPTDPTLAGKPYITYYARKTFVFSNSPVGAVLTFSNFLDDAAVMYLNGTEVLRTNMPAGTPTNGTYTSAATPCPGTGNPPAGNPTCPMVFVLSNSPALLNGTNVVSAEIHNYRTALAAFSDDAAFESALFYSIPVSVLNITNVVIVPGETNATIAWETTAPASTQVQYGTNSSLGSATVSNATLTTTHFATLTNLLPLTQYYVRLISSDGTAPLTFDATFSTVPFYQTVIPITQAWRYTAANISGANWTTTNYNDNAWPQGAGLLYVEDNADINPKNTLLPDDGAGHVMPTYYFRTHFTVTQSLAGFALQFTNLIDDGAVFYLNGREIQRIRMPSGSIGYNTLANDCPVNNCEATLDAADLFRLSGDALTNLVFGDNVLAAEVHQLTPGDSDVVFGTSIGVVRATAAETRIGIARSNNVLRVTWPGSSLTLQRATVLSTNSWSDVPGPVKIAPYLLTNPPGSTFFRLRD